MLLSQLDGKKVGVCVSGGLDSKAVAKRLLDAGVSCVAFTADLDQPDEENISDVVDRMAATGVETHVVDLKQKMAEACFLMVRAQASYDGGYWNTTGIARAVTVGGLLPAMKEFGCTVLAHGATGRGNDQIRFERYTNVLDPDMGVYAPWRDPELLEQFPGRIQMVKFLEARGIEASVGPRKRYSTDANIAGLSHEAEDLEELTTPSLIVEPKMCVWPHDAPDEIEDIVLEYRHGNCVAIDGIAMGPLEVMRTANARAGRNGIGLSNALENRIIGTKSRGVYEAPGLTLLGRGLDAVYQTTMDRRSTGLFRKLSTFMGDQIYDGRLFDPGARAAMAAIDVFARQANGTVTFGMYRGNLYFKGLTNCTNSLYNPADASMEASDGLNPRSSQGYVEVMSVEAEAMAKANQIENILDFGLGE